ncbi:MAG: molecular chaperone HtpG, partial [Bacteroidales bacterium]|nr:molecular chaperone HtpG [Bacteroidales bacterium]
ALIKNSEGKFFNYDEYAEKINEGQTNKDKKLVYLYCTDPVAQYQYVEAARAKGFDVLVFDCPLDAHFVNLLESKLKDATFKRVDAEAIDRLVEKEERTKFEISEEDAKYVTGVFEELLPKENKYEVKVENLGQDGSPILITQSEFMRRYRDMAALGGGMNFYGELPESYTITVNAENPVVRRMMGETGVRGLTADNSLLKQASDLALLANGMLKGKELSEFIKRSEQLLDKE